MNDVPTQDTLTQQVADDVRRAQELNKAMSEVVTKLANKLWVYAKMPDELAKDISNRHPTHISTEPTLQDLRRQQSAELRSRMKLIDDLYSITWQL